MTFKPAPAARPNPFTTKYVPAGYVEELEEQHNPKPSTAVIDGVADEETPQAPVEPQAQAPDSDPAAIKLAALAFSRECADMVAKDYERFASLTAQGFSRTVTIEFGRKYAKLISCDVRGGVESAQSVYCFVDLGTGDILKAATWRAPAKHARGNVLRADRMQSVTAYGANYLR